MTRCKRRKHRPRTRTVMRLTDRPAVDQTERSYVCGWRNGLVCSERETEEWKKWLQIAGIQRYRWPQAGYGWMNVAASDLCLPLWVWWAEWRAVAGSTCSGLRSTSGLSLPLGTRPRWSAPSCNVKSLLAPTVVVS